MPIDGAPVTRLTPDREKLVEGKVSMRCVDLHMNDSICVMSMQRRHPNSVLVQGVILPQVRFYPYPRGYRVGASVQYDGQVRMPVNPSVIASRRCYHSDDY